MKVPKIVSYNYDFGNGVTMVYSTSGEAVISINKRIYSSTKDVDALKQSIQDAYDFVKEQEKELPF